MMKHVSLARGLKEKNRLAGKLMELRASIRANNSRGDDSPRDIDVLATFEEMQKIQQRLLDVKAELAHANQGIVDQIIALEELKSGAPSKARHELVG